MRVRLKQSSFLKYTNSLYVIALVIIIPAFIKNNYILYICSLMCIYSIMSMALNLLMGLGGQTSLGNASFAAIGAYTAAILYKNFGVPFYVCILAAGLAATIVGFVIGLPSVRLSGHYLAVATMGFGVAVPQIALQWEALTGGAMGISISKISLFGLKFDTDLKLYYLNLLVLLLVVWTMSNIKNSRFGRRYASIRDSETAAQAMGVRLATNKTSLFAISAFYTGIAGAMYIFTLCYISYSSFSMLISYNLVTMIVVGGIGSPIGSIIGAGLFVILEQTSRQVTGMSELISGLVLILVVLFCPKGFMGVVEQIKSSVLRKRASVQDKVAPGGGDAA